MKKIMFLAVFLLWNEWYLPMLAKMVLAGAVGASGAIGIVLVGKWKRHLIKDNPIEEPKEDIPLEKNIEIGCVIESQELSKDIKIKTSILFPISGFGIFPRSYWSAKKWAVSRCRDFFNPCTFFLLIA